MSKRIQFEWNGTKYDVKIAVTQKDYVVLPNRKVLKVKVCWDGLNGPFIKKLEEVKNPLQHASLGEIVEYFGDAILANSV
jgi:hypothetical protein